MAGSGAGKMKTDIREETIEIFEEISVCIESQEVTPSLIRCKDGLRWRGKWREDKFGAHTCLYFREVEGYWFFLSYRSTPRSLPA